MKTQFYPLNLSGSETRNSNDAPATLPFDQLVAMRNPAGEAPLFCLHQSGGDVGIYRKLTTKLDRSRAIWGIQSRLQCGADNEFASLEEMAEEYTRMVVSQNPTGSIRLLGFSLGGFLASLMARNLHQSGRHVSFLGMIDSNPNWTTAAETSRRELRIRLTQVFTQFQKIGLLCEKPIENVQADVEILVAKFFQMEPVSAHEVLANVKSMGYLPDRQSDKILLNFSHAFLVHIQLLNDFKVPKIEVPLHLWWPSETEEENQRGATMWSEQAVAGVTQSMISGSHYSMMRGPSVRTLAAEVETAIAQGEL